MAEESIRIELPRPHAGQARVLAEVKRFNVLACGRRFGKTTFGINRLTGPALEGYPVGWFSPNYKLMLEVWRDFIRVMRPVTARSNLQDRRIELITGGLIEFWSLTDSDAGRSRKYKRIAIDEAAKVRDLDTAWNQAIRPTLADLKGDADFYSTPRGQDFFKRLFDRGQDPEEHEWACWQMPTSTNPFIDAAEIEELRKQLPERVYEQEILARFLDSSGGVFRGVRECVDSGRTQPDQPKPGVMYCGGCDLARSEDFTVVTVLDPSGRQVYLERFNQISWERQIAAIHAIWKKYPGTYVMDSTGVGDPIFEATRKAGVNVKPYQFTNASKTELIDGLALAIERGHVRLMDVPVQENELLAYEYKITPGRNVTMSAPEGGHDDTVIALALARWAQGKPRVPLFVRL